MSNGKRRQSKDEADQSVLQFAEVICLPTTGADEEDKETIKSFSLGAEEVTIAQCQDQVVVLAGPSGQGPSGQTPSGQTPRQFIDLNDRDSAAADGHTRDGLARVRCGAGNVKTGELAFGLTDGVVLIYALDMRATAPAAAAASWSSSSRQLQWQYKARFKTGDQARQLVWSSDGTRLISLGKEIKVWRELDEAGLPTWKPIRTRYLTSRPSPVKAKPSLDDQWLGISRASSATTLDCYSALLQKVQVLQHHYPIDHFEWRQIGTSNLLLVITQHQTLWIWGPQARSPRGPFTCLAIMDPKHFLFGRHRSEYDQPVALIPLPKTVLPDLQVSSIELFLLLAERSVSLVSLVGLNTQSGSVELPLRTQRIGSVQPLSRLLPRKRAGVFRQVLLTASTITFRDHEGGKMCREIKIDLEHLLSPDKAVQVDLRDQQDVSPAEMPNSPFSRMGAKTARIQSRDETCYLIIQKAADLPFTDQPSACLRLDESPMQLAWSADALALAILFRHRILVWLEENQEIESDKLCSSIELDLRYLGSKTGARGLRWYNDEIELLFDRHLFRLRTPTCKGKPVSLRAFASAQKRSLELWHPVTLEYLFHFGSTATLQGYCSYLASGIEGHQSGDFWHSLNATGQSHSATDQFGQTSLERNVKKIADSCERISHLRPHCGRLRTLLQRLPLLSGIPPNIDMAGRQFFLYSIREDLMASSASSQLTFCGYHSANQPLIVNHLTTTLQSALDWQMARRLGIARWLKDIRLLSEQMDLIARNELNKDDSRDPVLPSLIYLILGKKKLVQNLWRQAPWHPDSRNVSAFLKNDFEQARWQLAAKKNGYALLSKQRFQLAAFFFLLAGAAKDSINVCLRQLNDIDLALVIARLYEHDQGEPTRQDLHQTVLRIVLQRALSTYDRCTASWALIELGHAEDAILALCRPLSSIACRHSLSEGIAGSISGAGDDSMMALHYSMIVNALPWANGSIDQLEVALHSVRHLLARGALLAALLLARGFKFSQPVRRQGSTDIAAKPAMRPETASDQDRTPPVYTLNEEYEQPKAELTLLGKSKRKEVDIRAVESFSMDSFGF